jgi:hypothetical protein
MLPSKYRGFRGANAALNDLMTVARGCEPFGLVRVRLSPDQGPEMAGTCRLSAQVRDRGAVSLLFDDTPIITLTAREVRGGWLSINDDTDLALAIDVTSGRLHIADAIGQTPAPLGSTQRCASRRVARQGVRGWSDVLRDIAVVGGNPPERPHRPVSVVVEPEHDTSRRPLRDEDNPSEVSVFVADSEAFRLSAAAFRGAWLWDQGDETHLDIDASAGRPGGHWLLTHHISSRWGLH